MVAAEASTEGPKGHRTMLTGHFAPLEHLLIVAIAVSKFSQFMVITGSVALLGRTVSEGVPEWSFCPVTGPADLSHRAQEVLSRPQGLHIMWYKGSMGSCHPPPPSIRKSDKTEVSMLCTGVGSL